MTTAGLEVLERNVHLSHEWINELDGMLRWGDPHRSYRLLRVTLQTLRDCLPVVEAADLAAQLPTLLRGVFYEHWRPGAEKHRYDLDRFFAQIDQEFQRDPIEDTSDYVSIVFDFLSAKISEGEIAQAREALPQPIRELWPR